MQELSATEEYFNNLPEWDGLNHIKKLSGYLIASQIESVSNSDIETLLGNFMKWFANRVEMPERYFQRNIQLCIIGGHGIGKTRFTQWLCDNMTSSMAFGEYVSTANSLGILFNGYIMIIKAIDPDYEWQIDVKQVWAQAKETL